MRQDQSKLKVTYYDLNGVKHEKTINTSINAPILTSTPKKGVTKFINNLIGSSRIRSNKIIIKRFDDGDIGYGIKPHRKLNYDEIFEIAEFLGVKYQYQKFFTCIPFSRILYVFY